MIQVISSVLVHYLDSQTPPVQAELVGQEDRVRPDTYRGGRERDNLIISERQNIHITNESSPYSQILSLIIEYD